MAEGGPQLMGHFTGEQNEIDRWLADSRCFSKDADCACSGIFLDSSRIRILGNKDCNIPFKFLDVLFGPFDLGRAPSKRYDMAGSQKTKKGEEIPIPKRNDFFKNLKKAAMPSATRRPKKK